MNSIACVSAGAGELILFDAEKVVFKYDFKEWLTAIAAKLPKKQFTVSGVAEAVRATAEDTFKALGHFIGVGKDYTSIFYLIAGFEQNIPVIWEIIVTGRTDGIVGTKVTKSAKAIPVHTSFGFKIDLSANGLMTQQVRIRAPHLLSPPYTVERNANLAGLMLSIESAVNPAVGPPFALVIIRPNGIERKEWKPDSRTLP